MLKIKLLILLFYFFIIFILHSWQKQIVSLCFGWYVCTRLGVAISKLAIMKIQIFILKEELLIYENMEKLPTNEV